MRRGLRGGFQPPVRGSAGPCSPGRERLYIKNGRRGGRKERVRGESRLGTPVSKGRSPIKSTGIFLFRFGPGAPGVPTLFTRGPGALSAPRVNRPIHAGCETRGVPAPRVNSPSAASVRAIRPNRPLTLTSWRALGVAWWEPLPDTLWQGRIYVYGLVGLKSGTGKGSVAGG